MRVWTIQPLLVWEHLQDTGELHVDPAYYPDGFVPRQYPWLANRMQERIPGHRGGLPWWAYCDKPDLRWWRHQWPASQPQVRIEFEVKEVLAFPFWAWDIVYSGGFLSFTEQEHDAWETAMRQAMPDEDRWPLPQPWRSEVEASWLRLFDPGLPSASWGYFGYKGNSDNEAVFETLRL